MLFATTRSAAAPRTHDGFLLRGQIGPSFLGTSSDLSEGGTLRMRAAGAEIGLSIGGCPVGNLALHVDIYGGGGSPSIETPEGRADFDDGALSLAAIGVGVSYWTSGDFVVGASVVAAGISVSGFGPDPEESARTSPGQGVSLLIGKDWFVSDEWSLGAALHLIHARALRAHDDDGPGPEQGSTSSATSVGLLFGATYN